jgi:hypothetical protein
MMTDWGPNPALQKTAAAFVVSDPIVPRAARVAERRRVVLAPQFPDNHVLLGSFAFNALMGRRWPPQPGDLEEAEQICRSLGMGPLLERMPAGLLQPVVARSGCPITGAPPRPWRWRADPQEG